MTRPRWHDVVIVVSIVLLGAVGVWALWGDVRAWWQEPNEGSAEVASQPQT
jgi:hypothetical protein